MNIKREEETKSKLEVSSSYNGSTSSTPSSSHSELFKMSFHSQESSTLLPSHTMENPMPNIPVSTGSISRSFERRSPPNRIIIEPNESVSGGLPSSSYYFTTPTSSNLKGKALIFRENGKDYSYKTKGPGIGIGASQSNTNFSHLNVGHHHSSSPITGAGSLNIITSTVEDETANVYSNVNKVSKMNATYTQSMQPSQGRNRPHHVGPVILKKNFVSNSSPSNNLRRNVSENSIESISTFNINTDAIYVAGFQITSRGILKVRKDNYDNNNGNNNKNKNSNNEQQERVDIIEDRPFYLILNQSHVLGGGSGGTVYKAIHLPSFMIVAIKQVDTHDIKKRHQMVSELNILYPLKRTITVKEYDGISSIIHGTGVISTRGKEGRELLEGNQQTANILEEDIDSEDEVNNHDNRPHLMPNEIKLHKMNLEPFLPYGNTIHLPHSGIHEQILLNLHRRTNSIDNSYNNDGSKSNELGWTVHSLTPPRIRNQSAVEKPTTCSKGRPSVDSLPCPDLEKSIQHDFYPHLDWKAKCKDNHPPINKVDENKYLSQITANETHINNEAHINDDIKSRQITEEPNNTKISEQDIPLDDLRISISNSSPRAPFPDGTVDIINAYDEDLDGNEEEPLMAYDMDIHLDDQSDFNLSYSPSAWSTEGKRSRNGSQAGSFMTGLPPELKIDLADQDSINIVSSPMSMGNWSLPPNNITITNSNNYNMNSVNDPSKINFLNSNNAPSRSIKKLSQRKLTGHDPVPAPDNNTLQGTIALEDESKLLTLKRNNPNESDDFESDSDVSMEVEEEEEEGTIFGDMEGYLESSRQRGSVGNIKNGKVQDKENNNRKASRESLSEISSSSQEHFISNNNRPSTKNDFNIKSNIFYDKKRNMVSSTPQQISGGIPHREIDSLIVDKEQKVVPGLVSFYDAYKEPNKSNINLVMEYMSFGSLQDILKAYQHKTNNSSELDQSREELFHKKGAIIEEAALRNIAKDVLEGLNYLHDRNKVHRDIKPANLLVGREGRVKIADYGLVGDVGDISFVGTLKYMSPERVKNSNYDTKSDIWSFAFSLLTFALGKYPYEEIGDEGNREDTKLAAMISILFKKAPPIPQDTFTDRFQHFLKMGLEKDPEKRFSAKQLLRHPFITYGPGTHNDIMKMDSDKNVALYKFAEFCYMDSNDSNRIAKGMEELDSICECLKQELSLHKSPMKKSISNDQLRNLATGIDFPEDFPSFKKKVKEKLGDLFYFVDK